MSEIKEFRDEMVTMFTDLRRDMNQRFDAMDRRFDTMDQRMDAMDRRMDGMDARFDGMDARFDGIDARFDGMDRRFDSLLDDIVKENRENMGIVCEMINANQEENNRRFDRIEDRLLKVEHTVTSSKELLERMDVAEKAIKHNSILISEFCGNKNNK